MKDFILRYGLLVWTGLMGIFLSIGLYFNTAIIKVSDAYYYANRTFYLDNSPLIRIGKIFLHHEGGSGLFTLIILGILTGLPLMFYVFYNLKKRGHETKVPLLLMLPLFLFLVPSNQLLLSFVFWFVTSLVFSLFLADYLKPITTYHYA